MALIIEEGDISTDFSRRIAPTHASARRGEPLLSLMAGSLAIVIAIVNLAALIGLGPESIPGLVKRGTIVLAPAINGLGGKTAPGWWFVPETGFFVLTTSALAISAVGIVLSRRRGQPIASLVGFGLNTIAYLGGFVLALGDFRQ